MEFFDLVNISERYIELASPTTPDKLLTLGRYLRLRPGSRVIDYACAYAEALALWAERYGITGVGVELREHACMRARAKLSKRGLYERIEIVRAKAAEYRLGPPDWIEIARAAVKEYDVGEPVFDKEYDFDAATCIGASFVFGGFRPTIRALKRAVRPGGRLGIGEPYWKTDGVSPDYAARNPSFYSEPELARIARQEGFELEYVVRASQDDWDTYEAGNWHGLVRWLEDNPAHPEREAVRAHLHNQQDEYLAYGREYLGWAMYVLAPQSK